MTEADKLVRIQAFSKKLNNFKDNAKEAGFTEKQSLFLWDELEKRMPRFDIMVELEANK